MAHQHQELTDFRGPAPWRSSVEIPSHPVLLPTELERQPVDGGFVWVYLLLIANSYFRYSPWVIFAYWD